MTSELQNQNICYFDLMAGMVQTKTTCFAFQFKRLALCHRACVNQGGLLSSVTYTHDLKC